MYLNNETPFCVQLTPQVNEDGIETLFAVVKASFRISHLGVLSEQVALQTEDIYWGKKGKSSLKFPVDFHIGKAGTDIGVVGDAWAPDGHPCRQMDVSLSVGEVHKTLRIFGNRVWKGLRPSEPELFHRIPLRYENAYGGSVLLKNEDYCISPKNPIGKGLWHKDARDDINGVALPNIEDPQNLIYSPENKPDPVGFGFLAPYAHPRNQYAGTYDDTWKSLKAPYLPDDFNKRFNNSAHPDLITRKFLIGGEKVELTNMHADGNIRFSLPKKIFLVQVASVHGKQEMLNASLDTVIIEPNELRLQMIWRAEYCGVRNITHIKRIDVLKH